MMEALLSAAFSLMMIVLAWFAGGTVFTSSSGGATDSKPENDPGVGPGAGPATEPATAPELTPEFIILMECIRVAVGLALFGWLLALWFLSPSPLKWLVGWAPLILVQVGFQREVQGRGRHLRAVLRAAREIMSARQTRVALIAAVPFLLILFLECLIPDLSGDTSLYHFSAPVYYIQEGEFRAQPFEFCYHYPLFMEMLWTPALAAGLEQGAILLNFWMFVGSLIALACMGALLRDRVTGLVAAFILLTSSLALLLTPTAYVETGATFLWLCLAAALWLGWRFGRRRFTIAGGVIAGAVAGCKLIYLFPLGLIGIFLIAAAATRPWRRRGAVLDALAYGLPLLLIYGVWPLKNALALGNPFYPFLLSWFEPLPVMESFARIQFDVHGFPPMVDPLRWLARSVFAVIELYATGDLGFQAGMLAVPVMLALAFRRRRARFFWAMTAVPWLVLLHYGEHFLPRWFLPFYALFSLAAACLAREIVAARRGLWRLPPAAVVVMLIAGWLMTYGSRLTAERSRHRPWDGLTRAGRDAVLERSPMFRAAHLINRNAPPDSRTLIAISNPSMGRWLRRPFVRNGDGLLLRRRFVQNGDGWLRWMMEERGMTGADVAAALEAEGITHIVAPPIVNLAGWKDFAASHCCNIFSNDELTLFAFDPNPKQE